MSGLAEMAEAIAVRQAEDDPRLSDTPFDRHLRCIREFYARCDAAPLVFSGDRRMQAREHRFQFEIEPGLLRLFGIRRIKVLVDRRGLDPIQHQKPIRTVQQALRDEAERQEAKGLIARAVSLDNAREFVGGHPHSSVVLQHGVNAESGAGDDSAPDGALGNAVREVAS